MYSAGLSYQLQSMVLFNLSFLSTFDHTEILLNIKLRALLWQRVEYRMSFTCRLPFLN